MKPNDKSLLDGLEVDIAIPSLNLAIEWNGIVHYKPIYGEKKLAQIKVKDAEKQKIAEEKLIDLIVITDMVSDQDRLEEALSEVSGVIKQLITTESTGTGT